MEPGSQGPITMPVTSVRRIQKELEQITENPVPFCCAGPIVPSDCTHWQATIFGPDGTPYAGGIFFLDVRFPPTYPFLGPQITFLTRIYHPNICPVTGRICLSLLTDMWSPALTIAGALRAIRELMANPSPEDPIDASIASHYLRDRAQFDATARAWTEQHAM